MAGEIAAERQRKFDAINSLLSRAEEIQRRRDQQDPAPEWYTQQADDILWRAERVRDLLAEARARMAAEGR